MWRFFEHMCEYRDVIAVMFTDRVASKYRNRNPSNTDWTVADRCRGVLECPCKVVVKVSILWYALCQAFYVHSISPVCMLTRSLRLCTAGAR